MQRRIFIEGLPERDIAGRVASYSTTTGNGPQRVIITVSQIEGTDWIMLQVPADLEVWHYHSLALWLQGRAEDPAPKRTMVLSSSDRATFDYVLHVGESLALEGHQTDQTSLKIDVPSGVVERGVQVTPSWMPLKTLFMARGLPRGAAELSPARGLEVELALPVLGERYNPDLREGTEPSPATFTPPEPPLWRRVLNRFVPGGKQE